MSRKNSFIAGAFILTATGFITRMLGFVYRIYLSNIIGAEGMGLVQLVTPIYFLAITVCSVGTSTAIARLVAIENARGTSGGQRSIVFTGTAISIVVSLIVTVCVYLFADFIGVKFLGDGRTVPALRLLALAVPLSVITSCVRSYFYGIKRMGVPAAAQVLEQVARMAAIFIVAPLFLSRGLQAMCIMAVVGTIVGDFIAFIFVMISYHFKGPDTALQGRKASVKKVLGIAVPLTGNRALSSLINNYENVMIPAKLQQFGLSSSDALSTYGALSGMVMPLLFFPSILTNALSTNLLPMISEAKASGQYTRIANTVFRALRFSLLIGMGAAALFATEGYNLGVALYNQPLAGELLTALCILCPFLYIQSTFSGILNGLGLQDAVFLNGLVSDVLRILILLFLVPRFGLAAFIAGLMGSTVLVCILDIRVVLKHIVFHFNMAGIILRPLLAALISAACLHFLPPFTGLPVLIGLIVRIGLLLLVYVLALLLTGGLKRQDFSRLHKSKL